MFRPWVHGMEPRCPGVDSCGPHRCASDAASAASCARCASKAAAWRRACARVSRAAACARAAAAASSSARARACAPPRRSARSKPWQGSHAGASGAPHAPVAGQHAAKTGVRQQDCAPALQRIMAPGACWRAGLRARRRRACSSCAPSSALVAAPRASRSSAPPCAARQLRSSAGAPPRPGRPPGAAVAARAASRAAARSAARTCATARFAPAPDAVGAATALACHGAAALALDACRPGVVEVVDVPRRESAAWPGWAQACPCGCMQRGTPSLREVAAEDACLRACSALP